MAITEEARRNHDALFPNYASILGRTAPELVVVFDNWAFDEVLESRGAELPLEGERIDEMYERSPKDLLHIQKHLSASCFGDFCTRNGLDLKTRELLTFIGYPRTLNALRVVDDGTSE